jgi:hypothetical protein
MGEDAAMRLRAHWRLEPGPHLRRRLRRARRKGTRPKDSRNLESGDSGLRSPALPPHTSHEGDEMRRPIIATMDNGLPVQLLSRRDFLLPDADEKYVPAVLAYIHDMDVETLNTLLRTRTPEDVVATFPYLSDVEKKFACRALFDPCLSG